MHRNSSDDGSALPLLLGSLGLLVFFTLTLLGSAQFLQQQRQLNSKTDSIALLLASLKAREVSGATDSSLESQARSEIANLYQNEAPTRLQVEAGETWVQVAYCEQARTTIGAVIWGGRALVCAKSRAAIATNAAN